MTRIAVATNRTCYFNDIAEEIRLFTGMADIFLETEETQASYDRCIRVDVENTGDGFRASATLDSFAYTHFLPCEATATALIQKKIEKRAVKIAVFRVCRQAYATKTPWGSLTGIRPTKLYRELTAAGENAEDAFLHTFDVSTEKTALAREICRVQQPFVDSAKANDIDIYIGIPFCKTRCLYCSFAAELAGDGKKLEVYLKILHQDVRSGAALLALGNYHVRSIYFGGGTPTVLSATQLDALLTTATDVYGDLSKMECTVEAGRPDTITEEKLVVLKAHGVSRISINPQTMNDETLRRVGRTHTAKDIEDTVQLARRVGFSSINMDLIAGLPGETRTDFLQSLRRIAALSPENLTVHSLAIKRSSMLKAHMEEYELATPKEVDGMIAAGYEAARCMGLLPYYMYRQKYMSGNLENVGYALPDKVCAYNIDMMEETTSILAHGAGAMSKRVFANEQRIERIPNPKDISTYCEKLPRLIEERTHLFCD